MPCLPACNYSYCHKTALFWGWGYLPWISSRWTLLCLWKQDYKVAILPDCEYPKGSDKFLVQPSLCWDGILYALYPNVFPAPGWFGGPVSELSLAFMHLEGFMLEKDTQFQCCWCEMMTVWPHFCTAFPLCHFQKPFFFFGLGTWSGCTSDHASVSWSRNSSTSETRRPCWI